MIDAAFDSLVRQRLHLVLSSERPLALQHALLRLLHRLHEAPSVRVAADAPLEPTELIEHVNRIVSGLSVREATEGAVGADRIAVLPVRVSADRPPDSVQLLARLCRALPGSGLRLILIIEHPPALTGCLATLGAGAFHWEIGRSDSGGIDTPDGDLAPDNPPQPASPGSRRDADRTPSAASPAHSPHGEPSPDPPLREHAPSTSLRHPGAAAPSGLLSRIVDTASRRPLRFALMVAGIPGLVIAGVLALGSALQPSRPSPTGTSNSVGPSSAERNPPPKASAATPRQPEPSPAKAAPPATAPSSQAGSATPAPPTGAAPASPAEAAATKASTPPSAQARAPLPAAGSTINPGPASPSAGSASSASQPAPPPAAGPTNATTIVSPGKPAASPAPVAVASGSVPSVSPSAPSFECTPSAAPVPQVQPRNPSKDSGMVYLTSNRSVLVCVTDASGALTRAEITPEQSRSFFGKAPWQVQASSLRDLQVFFQGSRITIPRNANDRFELIEQRLN